MNLPPGAHWHTLPEPEALSLLASSPAGLSQAEADRRLRQQGPNRLPTAPKPGRIRRFLAQFQNVLIYVLLGAAVITGALGHAVDTGVILAVVLVNALIGYLQEGRAEQAMAAISGLLAQRAAVLRDGHRQTLPVEQLVPGDIVLLEAGDKVPADLRLLKAHDLRIQEAILTGESVPVEKQTEPVPADAALGDRRCLAFSGTSVSHGQGMGLVVATGTRTEIGRISGLLAEVEPLTTPLVAQTTVFARWLTAVILGVAASLLAYGYGVAKMPFDDLFMAVVGLSVAAIPEGLPAVLTITLAVGVQAMARRNAIVRRLPAIETLGAVSVICSDKTGTLTRNEMSVVTVALPDQQLVVTGEGYAPEGALSRDGAPVSADAIPGLQWLARVAALCNDAELQYADGLWRTEGDPMEGALLALAGRAALPPGDLRATWRRSDVIPFDTRHRFMATLNHDHEGHAAILVKGAPEAMLALCRQSFTGEGAAEPLDREAWRRRAEAIAGEGQRVLAFAMKPVAPEQVVLERSDLDDGLMFLGMVGLMDPPRPEAVDAVAECRAAGIQVKMITGDHAATALAIGRRIGLADTGRVLTGADLDRLDDAALQQSALETDVFARTSPEHKLRLVTALQARGLIVAMTGDGVNDAPALKRADAGIAMGRNGSEAAREAAELVLADDNFASIVAAVREGRTIDDNIRKVISWTLPTSTGEAAIIILALLVGMVLPVTPIQILWVNMATAVTLGIALAFEPTDPMAMARPPRPRSQPLLTGALAWHIVLVTGLFLVGVFGVYRYAMAQGHSLELARTLAMNTLVTMEIFHLLFIRNLNSVALRWSSLRGTPVVWAAVALVVAGQLALTYLPSLQSVFGTEAVPLEAHLWPLVAGVLLFVLVESEKQLRLRLRRQERRVI
ncbi:cation-transporting P-type ATPase [uncultured Marinobacter sp.]|uniref:cation-transporting P-type ATPase n=1 Tax=uncultured Marinobacter sp. TaxID=187379 RepID=UPI000C095C70|nr:carbonate dehydratase [Marinobacter sp.]MBI44356.1 carbonate dehydratase [Oceanospirillales bacterium]|tara:strand:- start:160 stop:2871 length:2712 start_codon:yes stop_codon:yes gene_type:complete